MINYREYGDKPYRMMLLHGGPGALGDMGYLANQLSSRFGVVEALQTKSTVDELIEELKGLTEQFRSKEISKFILVGHSWGAWLAYLFAAKYPESVEKLILVGSGPFEVEYVEELEKTRMERMTKEQRDQLEALVSCFYDPNEGNKDALLKELGGLMEIVDTYDAIEIEDQEYMIKVDGDLYKGIWEEAAALRKSGELLRQGRKLTMPVVVIHGEYDPHPLEGVIKPLEKVTSLQEVHILKKCGHTPWKEKYASERLIEILEGQI